MGLSHSHLQIPMLSSYSWNTKLMGPPLIKKTTSIVNYVSVWIELIVAFSVSRFVFFFLLRVNSNLT